MSRAQRYRDVIRVLRANGWVLLRQAKGSHEIWGLPDGTVREPIPHHREVSAGIIAHLLNKLPCAPDGWK